MTIPIIYTWKFGQCADHLCKNIFCSEISSGIIGIWYIGTENQLQVLIDFPRPASAMKENFYEDTMLLLEMIKDKRHKENREKKVSTI